MELDDVKALEAVLKALEGLDPPVQERVLRWAFEKLEFKPVTNTAAALGLRPGAAPKGTELASFESLAEALGAAHARTDAQRILVAAAYLTKKNGKAELTAAEINAELKNLGHPVNSISKTIDTLKEKRPQLMLQTKKSGTSRQARKNYKVTAAGFAAAERLLVPPEEEH